MDLEAGLLLAAAAVLVVLLAAVVWLGLAMTAEMRALRRKLDGLEIGAPVASPSSDRPSPRLVAAREDAAARAAKRPGRTTVKRI